MTYADVTLACACEGTMRGPDAGARQVDVDLTHPVSDFWLWNLYVVDRTQGGQGQVIPSVASGHDLMRKQLSFDRWDLAAEV